MRVVVACMLILIGIGLVDEPSRRAPCWPYFVMVFDPGTAACHAVGACDRDGNELAPPDQAACHGACEALPEAACIATAGCRILTRRASQGMADSFFACSETAPSGPIHAGRCRDLDAYACSRHDNCAAHYVQFLDGIVFDHCADERAR
jgi:hypothetical protein